MPDPILQEMLERKAYSEANWQPIRDEAETDMRFVGGDPWDDADRKLRKNRPTIAPEEMAQYHNHVINALRANPRGMKFTPTGNGANDDALAESGDLDRGGPRPRQGADRLRRERTRCVGHAVCVRLRVGQPRRDGETARRAAPEEGEDPRGVEL
jgi:hypothetical protein